MAKTHKDWKVRALDVAIADVRDLKTRAEEAGDQALARQLDRDIAALVNSRNTWRERS